MSLKDRIDRIAFSFFGDFYSGKSESYQGLILKMNQSRMSIDYDLYLARITLYSILSGAIGFILGIFITLLLVITGLILVSLPISFPGFIANIIEQYRVGVISITLSTILGLVFFLASYGLFYYLPYYRAGERGRRLDQTLPASVTYMYALSKGGMNMVDVFETMSESTDVYGEVAKEFDMIIKDMEMFGSDVQTAIIRASDTTPSDHMSDFYDDLVGLIDSGGDINDFLYNKSQQYHQIKEQNEEEFLDTLGLLSEAYITLFVAAPLFVIVITSILSLLGGGKLLELYLIVYIVLPMATAGFIVLVDLISTREEDKGKKIYAPDVRKELPEEEIQDRMSPFEEEKFQELLKGKKRYRYQKFLKNPSEFLIQGPIYTLVFTIPIAVLYLLGVLFSGFVTPTIDNLINNTWSTTTFTFIVPFLITMLPLTIFYEIKHRRKNKIANSLADALKKLSSSNEAGMSLSKGLKLVGETSKGYLPREFMRVYSISKWNTDIKVALIRMANRLEIPRLSRTMKLITEAKDSSGNIKEVLGIAARDAETAQKFDRQRKQNMLIYTMIIVLSFLIFLGVLAILQTFFLAEMASIDDEAGANFDEEQLQQVGFDPTDIPIDTYNMVFYHAAILQGLLSGLMAGKMGEDRALSGMKWSIAMVIVAVIAFAFL